MKKDDMCVEEIEEITSDSLTLPDLGKQTPSCLQRLKLKSFSRSLR